MCALGRQTFKYLKAQRFSGDNFRCGPLLFCPEATQILIAPPHQRRDVPIIPRSNFGRGMCLCFGHSSQTIAPLTLSFCQRHQHAGGEMLNDSLHFPKVSSSGKGTHNHFAISFGCEISKNEPNTEHFQTYFSKN
ncbi:hypothetical protein TNIN_266571 [Trichonephila inaurata madagascariensis]|uniref:Uncharacterized protein n=1 Tax=Trichonephila inaurata madagascariensis TaxID=2747483 RepID=A0A8X6YEX3_9ARAC|nr:hypothetical protein TNIN_266571 [Trichonephila inaurata madagascariensis]